jgi:hypothetical protein
MPSQVLGTPNKIFAGHMPITRLRRCLTLSAQFDIGLILFFSYHFCLIYLDLHVVDK